MHQVEIVNGVLVGTIISQVHNNSSNNINNKHHHTNNKTKINLTSLNIQNNRKMATMGKWQKKIVDMVVVVPKILTISSPLREILINIKEEMIRSNHL
jgi:hypothetical protein